ALLAKNNMNRPVPGDCRPESSLDGLCKPPGQDDEYWDAIRDAMSLRPPTQIVPVPGVIGVETDRDLVPQPFRVHRGDRVAVFGRWIGDCGHPDFHTEIHPPLLIAAARPVSGAENDATTSTVVGRPYLVSQRWELGSLRRHVIREALKIIHPPDAVSLPLWGVSNDCPWWEPAFIPCSTQIEAHPSIMPKPFAGNPGMSYVIRPPSPRRSSDDRLCVRFRFTVRTGVEVTLLQQGPDQVRANLNMHEGAYNPPPLPPK